MLIHGDTIFFPYSKWVAAVLEEISDRERYIKSLELRGTLDFDLLVPGIAAAGEPYYTFVEKPKAERYIGAIYRAAASRRKRLIAQEHWRSPNATGKRIFA